MLRLVLFILFFSQSALFCWGQKHIAGKNCNEISFEWQDVAINGKFYEKAIMLLPVFIKEEQYFMQLDLGTYESVLYIEVIPKYVLKKIKEQISFTDSIEYKDFVEVNIDDIYFENGRLIDSTFIVMNYKVDSSLSNIQYLGNKKIIGTIGRDLIQKKCKIDYPNKKFIYDCDDIRLTVNDHPIKIQIVDRYLIYLPVKINQQTYWALFDTGSSMFSLLLTRDGWQNLYPANLVSDSISINSWGAPITVFINKEKGDLTIENQLYAYEELFHIKDDNFNDSFSWAENEIGILGNYFFLNNSIIIDYENREMIVR